MGEHLAALANGTARMIREFSIKNYKSIVEMKLDLGRINLFIGENGCGKTNILEAFAMAAAAASGRLDTEELYLRGVRVAKPAITLSSFAGLKQGSEIELGFATESKDPARVEKATLWLTMESKDATSSWKARWEDELEKSDLEEMQKRSISIKHNAKKTAATSRGEGATRDAALFLQHSRDLEKALKFLSMRASQRFFFERAGDFPIYNANQLALRGLMNLSRKEPLGINGENLDVAIASLGDKGIGELLERSALIRWVEHIFTDPEDKLKFEGYKLGRSTSTLYFRDRCMRKRANVFSAENANEGILHALFYLTLFISDRTPETFGIDNIETALNPRLCRNLIKQLAELSKGHDKQALITTHNPAALDGLDLNDDDQRLFVIARNDAGHTVATRIKVKPQPKGKEPKLMLSEMWMRGLLGGIPLEF